MKNAKQKRQGKGRGRGRGGRGGKQSTNTKSGSVIKHDLSQRQLTGRSSQAGFSQDQTPYKRMPSNKKSREQL